METAGIAEKEFDEWAEGLSFGQTIPWNILDKRVRTYCKIAEELGLRQVTVEDILRLEEQCLNSAPHAFSEEDEPLTYEMAEERMDALMDTDCFITQQTENGLMLYLSGKVLPWSKAYAENGTAVYFLDNPMPMEQFIDTAKLVCEQVCELCLTE